MKKNSTKISFILLLCTFLYSTNSFAVSGIKVIPTDYATLALAITDLNTNGVGAGGATITFASSYTAETAPIGGYNLGSTVLNASLSAANPLVFNGSLGGGARMNITAYTPQTVGSLTDAIWKLKGTDYVTIQNFTLKENAGNIVVTAASNTRTEWGIALLKLNASAPIDGCNHVTIQNDSISLNKTTTLSTSSGIYANNHIASISTSAPTILTSTAAADANSDNVVRNNVIFNVQSGIYWLGFAQTVTTTNNLYDKRNLIGGSASTDGNIIYNYDGYATNSGWGIYMAYNDSNTIQFNNVQNALNGANGLGTLGGIYQSTSVGASPSILDNTVKLNQGSVTSTAYGIGQAAQALATFTNTTIRIQRNNVSVNSAGSSNSDLGIYNFNNFGNCYITDNVVGNCISSSTGIFYGIANAASSLLSGGVFYDTGNLVTNITRTASSVTTTGPTACIYNSGQFYVPNTYIYNLHNKVTNILSTNATNTGYMYYIYDISTDSFGKTTKVLMRDTVINNIHTGPVGAVYCIYARSFGNAVSAVKSSEVAYNYVNKNKCPTQPSSGYTQYLMYLSSDLSTAYDVHDNVLDNNYSKSNYFQYGLACLGGGNQDNGITNPVCNIYNNTISNDSLGSSVNAPTFYCMYTGTSWKSGLNPTANVYNNKVFNNYAAAGNTMVGAAVYTNFLAFGTTNFYNNNIYNLQADLTTTQSLYGIFLNFGNQINIYNNFISDLRTPFGNNKCPVMGIYAAAGLIDKIYNNTVYINPTTAATGVNFGANALTYLVANPSGSSVGVSSLDLKNNIFYCNAIHQGLSNVAAIRQINSSGLNTAPAVMTSSSNNNLLYVPVGDTSAFLYGEGDSGTYVNCYNVSGLNANPALNKVNDPLFNSSCSLFKAYMFPRHSASFTENTMQTAALPNTFTPTASTASYAYQGGIDLSASSPAITTDYSGATRLSTPCMGALEFSSSAIDATAPAISYVKISNTPCVAAQPTLTASITDASGVGGARLYFKRKSENASFGNYPTDNNSSYNGWKYVDGVLGIGTSYSFTFNYSLLTTTPIAMDTIQYFVIAADNAFPLSNVGYNLVNFSSTTCPTSTDLTGAPTTTGALNYYRIDSLFNNTSKVSVPTNQVELCMSGFAKLTANPDFGNAATGLTYQWYHTGGTGNFSPVSGAILDTFNTGIISASDTFNVRYVCNSIDADTTSNQSISVSNPQLINAHAGHSACGSGIDTLFATPSGTTDTIRWYSDAALTTLATPSAGSAANGSVFISPYIGSSTTYYAVPTSGKYSNSLFVGQPKENGSFSYYYAPNANTQYFSTTQAARINSFQFYPYFVSGNSGTTTFVLLNGTGYTATIMGTITVPTPNSNFTTPTTVYPTNWVVPAGASNWSIGWTDGNVLAGNSVPVSYNYPQASNGFAFTGNTVDGIKSATVPSTGTRWFLYNWNISTFCRGASTAVLAPVSVADTIGATITTTNPCAGTLDSLNAVSPNANYIYDIYENSLAGSPIYTGSSIGNLINHTLTPSISVSRYVVKAHDASGCSALDTIVMAVNPAAPNFSLTLPNVCPNGTDTFTAYSSATNYVVNSIPFAPLSTAGATKLCTAGSALVTPTYSTVLTNLDDNYWDNITLPFTFNYFGVNYDSIAISTNGNIQFVNPSGNTGTVLTPDRQWLGATLPSSTYKGFAGPDWSDFDFSAGGEISYKVVGTTPNRKFYVNWIETSGYHVTPETCQIILNELTNVIETHVYSASSFNRTIGINSPTGTIGYAAPGRNGVSVAIPTNEAWSFSPIPLGTYAWSGPTYTGTFTNVNTTATAPLTTATPSDAGTYTMVFTDATTGCKSTNTGTLMLNTPTNANGLAAVSGGSQICQSYNVGTGWKFNDGSCDWIAKVTPAGASPVTGMVNSCAKVDATVQTYLSKPYAPRHWDITPTTNASTATANVTLYVDQATFNSYNATAGPLGYAAMPTGPTGSTASLLVHQYHGTGTAPGNYTGTDVVLTPTSVTWNANFNWWEVTVPVTGFSGFYLETKKPTVALTVMLQGPIQAGGTMVNWLQVDTNYANSSFLQPRLPKTDPYGVGVTYNSINDTTGNSLNPGAKFVTDWVNVETRKVSAPSVVVESRALLLKPNGSIVDTNRAAPAFKAIAEPMFFVVKQRNHLAVQSATLSSLLSNTVYDFTTGLTQAYSFPGDPDPMVLSNGKWCMWTADIVNDGIVDAGDLTFGLADYNSGSNDGYLLSDLNMDGLVEAFDLTILSNNYNNIVSSPILNY